MERKCGTFKFGKEEKGGLHLGDIRILLVLKAMAMEPV